MRNGFWLAVVALALVSASVSTGDPPKETQYQIEVKVSEGDPLGSREEGTIRVLAEPCLCTLENVEAHLQAGGIKKFDGEEAFEGLQIKITAERSKEGTIRLKMVVKITEVVSPKEDSLMLQSNVAHYVRTVKPGEVLRLKIGKMGDGQQWVELSAKELERGK